MIDMQQENITKAQYSSINVAVTIFELENAASKIFSPRIELFSE